MTVPDPGTIVRHLIALYGGPESARKVFEDFHNSIETRWNQDAELLGRILRSHLFVEHFLTQYIRHANPGLGSLQNARLGFAQKIALIGDEARVAELVPGLKRLNKVRNRIAHTLVADVSKQDASIFLSLKSFVALRTALSESDEASDQPIDVLESFAKYVGSIFASEAGGHIETWSQAIEQAHKDASSSDI